MTTSLSSDVQILLVELQPTIVDASKTLNAARIRRSVAALKEIADAAQIPVTATAVALDDEPPRLIDELNDLEPLVRSTVSPFHDPAIAARIKAARRNTLVIGGISSEIAVLHTALDALQAGYTVHLLADVCGGLDARSERAALERMGRAGVLPSSLSSFATALIDDMGSELGRTVMQTLGRFWGWSAQTAIDADIRKVLRELTDAWREGDADRFAGPFADKARFVAFDGRTLSSPLQIAKYHRKPFATHLAGTTLELRSIEIVPVGERAWSVSCEGGIERAGQTEGELIGKSVQTFLLQRTEQSLEILAFQNTRVRPIDGPASAAVWKQFDEAWSRLSHD